MNVFYENLEMSISGHFETFGPNFGLNENLPKIGGDFGTVWNKFWTEREFSQNRGRALCQFKALIMI